MDSANGCKLYLYPDVTNIATAYHYGPALIDGKMEAQVNGAIKITGTFVANGNWGRNGI